MNTENSSEIAVREMELLLESQREAFIREGAVSAETRIARLNTAIDILIDNKDRIVEVMSEDFGNRSRHQSLMSDLYSTIEGLKHNRKGVNKWMRASKRPVQMPLNLFGARARVEYQPKGVVGILGTWNFPINTVFAPLGGVLAAGNRAVLKFSEITPGTAALMEELVERYFERDVVACISGGPAVGAAFSSLEFDHLVFTGAGSIGKHVMRAAAENLTPVTLELGGKSPVIIARDADLKETAVRIMTGKALNGGQVCLSPDYLFVPEEQLETFLGHAREYTAEAFPTLRDNPDFTSVVNERHRERLLGYLEDAAAKGARIEELNAANEDFSQQDVTHKIPFTLVVNPTDDMKIMQEEIFGPLIAVKPYKDVDDCIAYINAHDRPLGLYIFSGDKAVQNHILDNTLSGGVTINDVMGHPSCEDLPFGGIGPSGLGHYRGYEGFKEFSHARAVYTQTKINLQRLGGMMPPYTKKCEDTLDGMIKK